MTTRISMVTYGTDIRPYASSVGASGPMCEVARNNLRSTATEMVDMEPCDRATLDTFSGPARRGRG